MSEWTWPDTTIDRVIDGDTIQATVVRDLGFGGQARFPVRLRLNRINAAKGTTKRGATATARVQTETSRGPVHVTTVKPYKYSGPKDMTGEYMAEIVLPGGTNLSDLLVAEKLATYWDGTGPRPDDA